MVELNVVIEPGTAHPRRIAYVIETYLDFLGLGYRFVDGSASTDSDAKPDPRTWTLYYGHDHETAFETGIAILPSRDRPGREVKPLVDPRDPGQGISIPALAGTSLVTPGDVLWRYAAAGTDRPGDVAIAYDGPARRKILVGADIVTSAFFFLSRDEEIEGGERDGLDRFLAEFSFGARHDLLDTPVVELYARLLFGLVLDLAASIGVAIMRKATWPEFRRFALCLTHDIDLLKRWTVSNLVKDTLRCLGPGPGAGGLKATLGRFSELAAGLLKRRHPTNNLVEIMELEKEHSATSSFYFLPGVDDTEVQGRPIVGRYQIDSGYVRRSIERLASGNCEIGLHGSFYSYRDPGQIALEKARIEQIYGKEIAGNRQHFLRVAVPETLRYLCEAGFEHDSSLGYSDEIGYRSGCSLPYNPYDLTADERIGLLEIPLVIMDGVLLHAKKLPAEAAWKSVLAYLNRTRATGGLLTILWHNTSFIDYHAPGYRDVYSKALRWTARHQGWGCSASEVSAWWQRRRKLRLRVAGADEAACECRLDLPPQSDRAWLELYVPKGLKPSLGGERDLRATLKQDNAGDAMTRWDIEVSGVGAGKPSFEVRLARFATTCDSGPAGRS